MEFEREYGHEYEGMSETKKVAFVQKVKNSREQEAMDDPPAVRKLNHGADAEVRGAIKTIVDTSKYLNDRAGYAIMSFGARSDYAATRGTFDMVPDALLGFIESSFGITASRFTLLMETYMLSGGATGQELHGASAKTLRSEVSERLRISFGKFVILLNLLPLLRSI